MNEKKNGSGARSRLRSVVILVVAMVVLQAGPAWSGGTAANAGVGAAAALSSLVYGPVKLVYATLGGLVGGIAWGLSGGDSDVKNAVIMPAVLGDYVITPSIIRGEEQLEFVGRRPGYGREAVVTSEVIEEGF